jgi:hypothetical protein
MTLDANGAETLEQLHRGRLADLTISVANNGNFFSAFHSAGQRERTHRAALGPSDDIAGVAEPNELFLGHAEDLRKNGVQANVNARERDEWKSIGEVGGMQAGVRVTSESAVIRVDDGFQ